jgi:beta-lactamase superfamily II metal-dependent hydrolase
VQTAIASGGRAGFRHPHQIVTDIWVRREAAWRAPAARKGG